MGITINREFVSAQNSSGTGNPCVYIVIHETDNTNPGAGARTHAQAQCLGHFSDMSVHYYSGSDGVYQAAEHTCKCWHVGRSYVSNPNVPAATNANTIGIEICVNSDGDYARARQNAIALVQYLMETTDIPDSRVIRHYDAKGKYCPRKMMDTPSLWTDFKEQIGNYTPADNEDDGANVNKQNIIEAQVALNRSFDAAIVVDGIWGAKSQAAWNKALQITLNTEYDEQLMVDGIVGVETQKAIRNCRYGEDKLLVGTLQIGLYARNLETGSIDCCFGAATETATKAFQEMSGLTVDGVAGQHTFVALSML